MTHIDRLPNDPIVLKQLLAEKLAAIERLREEATEEIERLKAEQQAAIDQAVQAAVAAILRRCYGPRSEKFDPRQLLLFGQQIENTSLDAASIEDEVGEKLLTRRVTNRNKHGRQLIEEQSMRVCELTGYRRSTVRTNRYHDVRDRFVSASCTRR